MGNTSKNVVTLRTDKDTTLGKWFVNASDLANLAAFDDDTF